MIIFHKLLPNLLSHAYFCMACSSSLYTQHGILIPQFTRRFVVCLHFPAGPKFAKPIGKYSQSNQFNYYNNQCPIRCCYRAGSSTARTTHGRQIGRQSEREGVCHSIILHYIFVGIFGKARRDTGRLPEVVRIGPSRDNW